MKFGWILAAVVAACFFMVSEAEAGLVARVDLSSQTLTVIQDGEIMYRWPVSTARRGYRTPTGSWRPKRLQRMWYSRKYDMSPMPYSVFYNGGYAIHGTGAISRLGRPASHGCVRLHPANARTFYGLVRMNGIGNTRIVVQR
ncbi:L,D-transpeptidase [Jiella sp. MQZ9-1]|uniref:L,D-transpeptidase n=1 Tax=Jiella flava TaxID=2816857 RepID=A0A939FSN1_9HYPH|nr:L,D-transpeptidase [Jiella flava]MBO0661178.1 L,D-transpeptidase [Jiella flava]MCD2469823.1 L,D-transpeptidase [Jiella flava]